MLHTIKFYRTTEPYGCFSNFARYPIQVAGKMWPTSEHYFQAQKFAGTPDEEAIRLEPDPRKAAAMGRQRNRPLRSDWEAVKDDIMRAAVRAKVEQRPAVRAILLSTGDCTLVEHTANDAYWADNGDGTGKNMLGTILMEIRNGLPEYDGVFYLPPWLAYPDVHPYEIHWRMGGGEDYIMRFGAWLDRLSAEALQAYQAYFEPPGDWEGYWSEELVDS